MRKQKLARCAAVCLADTGFQPHFSDEVRKYCRDHTDSHKRLR